MRLNQFIAQHTTLSRRTADTAISAGRVEVNGVLAKLGDVVIDTDKVSLDGHLINGERTNETIVFHKPVSYVCSRNGQGSKTIYDLLPKAYHHLNPVGRLDKDSSGLLLLTNDGTLAHQLTHPSFEKQKVYEVTLDKPLVLEDKEAITKGVQLEDGMSKLTLESLGDAHRWRVRMHEGRNRQIRRTFTALGYRITTLHRTAFGTYRLDGLRPGECKITEN